jgi:hypothetical protein
MSEQAGMSGELIYEHAVQISQVTEYGVALTGCCRARRRRSRRGARFDYRLMVPSLGRSSKARSRAWITPTCVLTDVSNVTSTPKLRPRTARRSRLRRWRSYCKVGIADRSTPVEHHATTSAAEYSWGNPIHWAATAIPDRSDVLLEHQVIWPG